MRDGRDKLQERKIVVIGAYPKSLVDFRGKLLDEMIARNCQLIICAPYFDEYTLVGLSKKNLELRQTPVSRHGAGLLENMRYFLRLYSIIRDVKPDLVFTFTAKPNIFGAFASALAGRPTVAMVTGLGVAFYDSVSATNSFQKRFVKRVVALLYVLSFGLNRQVILQNKDDLKRLVDMGVLRSPEKAVVVNGSGVDLDAFPTGPLPERPVFLMAARLLWSKGIAEFCDAANKVKTLYPEAVFNLLGMFDAGPDALTKDDLEKMMGPAVRHLGFVDDIRPFIEDCSVFVLPSYREGLPRSVLEAMSMGRPIITTDAPGCRETVVNGDNGFLVEPQSSSELCEAMLKFCLDPGLAHRMGVASRQRVAELFDVNLVNQTVLEILEFERKT